MQMPDPVPKASSQRRRRNKPPVSAEKVAPRPVTGVPELPDSELLLEWTTGYYWPLLWNSPLAAIWSEFDVPAVIRLAQLQDLSMRRKASAAQLSEIRQLEDRFGLSPLARRRLQWELDVVSGDDSGAEPDRDQDDRWLRVVG